MRMCTSRMSKLSYTALQDMPSRRKQFLDGVSCNMRVPVLYASGAINCVLHYVQCAKVVHLQSADNIL
jgi:hypothetical protein